MEFLFALLLGLVGLAVGSFLNVCIDRLPRERPLTGPPSHCESCGRRLTVLELVPVASYIALGGRCRTCRARIPARLPLVEAATGLLFFAIGLAFGPTGRALSLVLYAALFVAVFVIDLEHGLVLDRMVYPGAAMAFVLSALDPGVGPLGALIGGAVAFALFLLIYVLARDRRRRWPFAIFRLLYVLARHRRLRRHPRRRWPFAIFRLLYVLGGGGMAFGDVKLAALIGLAAGFPTTLVAFFVAFVLGGVAGAVLLASGLRRRRDAVPFGPFLVVGAGAALLWGKPILDWYLRLRVVPW